MTILNVDKYCVLYVNVRGRNFTRNESNTRLQECDSELLVRCAIAVIRLYMLCVCIHRCKHTYNSQLFGNAIHVVVECGPDLQTHWNVPNSVICTSQNA